MASYIYINGYPGIGKLTIAKALQPLLSSAKIFHNHLMIDPVAAILDRSAPEYQAVRANVRRVLLDAIATTESISDVTWIFTDSRSSTEGSEAVQDYRAAADRRGVPFISVVLSCGLDENLARAVCEDRKTSTKLTDVSVVEKIRREEDIYRFGGETELELDITELTAVEAAETIARHVKRVLRGYLNEAECLWREPQ